MKETVRRQQQENLTTFIAKVDTLIWLFRYIILFQVVVSVMARVGKARKTYMELGFRIPTF